MKSEELFEIIGDIDETKVAEAGLYMEKGKGRSFAKWGIWAAAAACAVLALAVGISGTKRGEPTQTEPQLKYAINNPNAVEELSKQKLAVNRAQSVMSSDMDVEYQFYSDKLPIEVWRQILDEFYEFTGVSYEDFTAKFQEPWEISNFYSLSVRGYKDGWVEEEYRLHDYVFELSTENGGRAIVAMCPDEMPLRDYLIVCENPEKSEVNGVEMIIYAYNDSYMTQFSYGNVNYDVETKNISLGELENLIYAITGGSKTGEVQDVPADGGGMYIEAVDSGDLQAGTAEIFCGSYLDENGSFVVLLTEDTAENRAAVCSELGISESGVIFKTGTYTLAYLTQLQDKISSAMVNKELQFVLSSAVRENLNRIEVGVTTDDEREIDRLMALDTLGGAIEVEYTTGAVKEFNYAVKE